MIAAIPTFGHLADAAQDLEDSLGNIRLIANLLLSEDHALPEIMRREYLGALAEKVSRLQGVAEEMTTLVKIHAHQVEMESCSLHASEIVHQTVEAYSAEAARRHVSIQSIVEDGEPLIIGDYWKLSRAIAGVLSVVLRTAAPGGSITATVESAQKEVVVTFVRSGKLAPPNPAVSFFPADQETGSVKLGFTLAEQLVALHGGSLQAVESATEMRVTIHLPAK